MTAEGVKVVPRKPIESGCNLRSGVLVPADAAALRDAAGQGHDLDAVCRYRFEPALSPERAARLAGVSITTAELADACWQGVGDELVVVEGAGGFYSPLASDGLNADLAARLGLPVLLVADDRLGVINHVLLTAEAIRRRGLELMPVVLSASQPPEPDTAMDNVTDLRRWLDWPILAIAHGGEDASSREALRILSRLADRRDLQSER